jgi:putative 4-mercaptohistidine N1-methyltranferase
VDWCRKAGVPLTAALDVGCAVGRSSFDLSADFARVVGVDFSHAFVAAAVAMRDTGSATYTMTVEGGITARHVAKLPASARASRVSFRQGDACALPPAAALGGRFTLIHAANLLCRLPSPRAFLNSLPGLLEPRGLVVFISPYSWLAQYTPREEWLGGTTAGGADGAPRWSADGLRAAMEGNGFRLVHEEECPFLIREHARKFQWGCSHVTVFQLVGK